jgi:hypothetical protein
MRRYAAFTGTSCMQGVMLHVVCKLVAAALRKPGSDTKVPRRDLLMVRLRACAAICLILYYQAMDASTSASSADMDRSTSPAVTAEVGTTQLPLFALICR